MKVLIMLQDIQKEIDANFHGIVMEWEMNQEKDGAGIARNQ